MPNWCNNSATFTHTDEELANWLLTTNFNFQKIIPLPKINGSDWNYDAACHLWGVKWMPERQGDDITMSVSTKDDKKIYTIDIGGFDTPWGPPDKIYEFLHAMGFTIDARYVEEGMGFFGEYITEQVVDPIIDCWRYSRNLVNNSYDFDDLPEWNDDEAWENTTELNKWVDEFVCWREYQEERAEEEEEEEAEDEKN